jgi:SPOR domain
MADRYQDRPFPADGYGRGGDQHGAGRGESDPLAELARLIGQTDPFGTGRANPPPVRPPAPRNPPQQYQPPQYQPPAPQYDDEPEVEEERPAGPPPWMQRANQREIHRDPRQEVFPETEYEPEPVHPVHPLRRYEAQPIPEDDYQHEPPLDERDEQLDPSRYDDALYGQIESGAQDFQRDPAYPDDPYAYQEGYEDEVDEGGRKRRGGFLKVAAVLALAVLGTGAAFAYHTYFTSARSGDVPIIRADTTPTKIMPAPADSGTKVPDRMVTGDATEKLVPREETPIDINANSGGPRVVFPSLNPSASPSPPSSVPTSTMTTANAGSAQIPTNGTMPSSEPHKIRTLTVRGDQPDAAAAPVNAPPPASPAPPPAKPAKQTAPRNPSSANASANAPLSLSPQTAQDQAPEPRTHVAATNPAQTAPAAPSSGGEYLVSVSSQQSEADAQNSYRMLQNKFPTQLGSRSPVIRKADLGSKVVYRAMVGPFASSDEAKQFCVDYKAAGGQCFIPKN